MVLPSQRAGGQLLSLSQASVPGLSRPTVTPGSMRPLPGPRPRVPPDDARAPDAQSFPGDPNIHKFYFHYVEFGYAPLGLT